MNIDKLTEEYKKLQSHQKATETRLTAMKGLLLEKVAEIGEPDEKGHIWYQSDHWLLKRERRVKPVFDQDACMEWAEEENIPGIIVTVTPEPYETVDEDALAAYAYLHREEEGVTTKVKGFYTEEITWAFAAPKAQDRVDY